MNHVNKTLDSVAIVMGVPVCVSYFIYYCVMKYDDADTTSDVLVVATGDDIRGVWTATLTDIGANAPTT